MTWRAARSLLVLHAQLKLGAPRAAPPATDVDAWGLIGDAAHDPTSDHAPKNFPGWGSGIVTAADFPNRPDLGLDAHRVLDDIRKARDPRAKYGISNGQIFSNHAVDGYAAWTWRPYNPKNGDRHFTHGHLSVVGDARTDGTQPWPTIGADIMSDLTDKVPGWAENGWNSLAVVLELRKALLVDINATGYGAPTPGSALGQILGKLDTLLARPAVDVPALAAALQGPLSDALGQSVPHEAIVTALQSDEGQAALVRAANTAEDA